MVRSVMFILAGTMSLFAFLAIVPPDGGSVMLVSQAGPGGILEADGGMLLLVGLFTHLAAFLFAGEMAVASFRLNAAQGSGPVMNDRVPAVLYCVLWLFFFASGPGPWTLDAVCAGGQVGGRASAGHADHETAS